MLSYVKERLEIRGPIGVFCNTNVILTQCW